MRISWLLLGLVPLAACGKSDSFAYDPSLPAACKTNVEFLVTCAGKKPEPTKADLLGRARTMQGSYVDSVKKDGAAKAGARCAELAPIVRSNPSCK